MLASRSVCLLPLVTVIAIVACGDREQTTGSSTTSDVGGGQASGGKGGQASGGQDSGGAGGQGATGGEGAAGGQGASGGRGGSGGFPANMGFPTWNNGTSCANEPDVQTWWFADDTAILRQSLCTNFEGPFIYVLLGEDTALVQDTGTGAADVAGAVADVIATYESRSGYTIGEVIVSHSHSHGDHVGGDGAFAALGYDVIGLTVPAVSAYFGIASWPDDVATVDLGSRIVDVVPIPGHHVAHVALYDRRHGLVFTGDTLYPGRLYVSDHDAYQASMARLVDFLDGQAVQFVLGTHIEMTDQPGQDFPFGSTSHPDEHPLELTQATLLELNDAIQAQNGPACEVHDDFIIYPLPGGCP